MSFSRTDGFLCRCGSIYIVYCLPRDQGRFGCSCAYLQTPDEISRDLAEYIRENFCTRGSQRFKCPCGSDILYSSRIKHMSSKKHQKYARAKNDLN